MGGSGKSSATKELSNDLYTHSDEDANEIDELQEKDGVTSMVQSPSIKLTKQGTRSNS